MLASLKVIDDKKFVYDIYYQNKKIKKKKGFELENNSTITLVEQNILLIKFWWFLIIFTFIFALFDGAPDDLKDVRNKQRIIKIKLGNIIHNKIFISIKNDHQEIIVSGADNFEVLSNLEENRPIVDKRRKKYKIIIISTASAFLLTVFLIILIAAVL